MNIWAFNKPNESSLEFVTNSLQEGISRFGWSYIDTADLRELQHKSWDDMSEDELLIWSKTSFLLNIKKDDWIVHINVPNWGMVTTGQVVKEYNFDKKDNEISDFRHFFKLDKETIIQFDRDNSNVLPSINKKLKLRGRYWQIYAKKDFFTSINSLKQDNYSNKFDKIVLTDFTEGIDHELGQPITNIRFEIQYFSKIFEEIQDEKIDKKQVLKIFSNILTETERIGGYPRKVGQLSDTFKSV